MKKEMSERPSINDILSQNFVIEKVNTLGIKIPSLSIVERLMRSNRSSFEEEKSISYSKASSASDCSELLFIKLYTNQLFAVSLNSRECTKLFDLSIDLFSYGSAYIPDSQSTFFYGGYTNGRTTGIAFIVDKDKNYIELSSGASTHGVGLAYHRNFVYAFGCHNQIVSAKYNLLANRWEPCEILPRGGEYTDACTAVFRDSVLMVAWYFSKLLSYDIRQNCFQEISDLNLSGLLRKEIFSYENRVYICEFLGSTYQSAINDATAWEKVAGNTASNFAIISHAMKFAENFYFVRNQGSDLPMLVEFNLKKKRLLHVKEL
ncbi:unnamed protein product [Blepharisma stoltei]|uniref:Uncharacterized protein n=1 Tax=Blepharisma stoltei TaxID=1481888 RepID=A0AAU9JW70_9CILI|nr:unnamed protein product [Blepharisma stoltei]